MSTIKWYQLPRLVVDGIAFIIAGYGLAAWQFAQPLDSWIRNPATDPVPTVFLGIGLYRILTTLVRWKTRTDGEEHAEYARISDLAVAVLVALILVV